jgi:hypothetical protein
MTTILGDILPAFLKPYATYLYLGVAVVVLAVVGFIAFKILTKKKPVDPDAGLDENLAEYPPAPKAGTHRLQFEGRPVRIRLVVLAPTGRATQITTDMAEGLLETILSGLGSTVQLDRPRIKVWPPQLSLDGFAPTFHRHVQTPEPAGKPSRFTLVAGPAKAGAKQVLLGLALETKEPSTRGLVRMSPTQWPETLRVQVVE